MALSKCFKYIGFTFQKYKKPNRKPMLKPTKLSSTEGGSKKCLGVNLSSDVRTRLIYRCTMHAAYKSSWVGGSGSPICF